MEGSSGEGMDLIHASPFAEPYPICREEIVSAQPSIPWPHDLDYVLRGLVRKYVFDFHRTSKALRKYIDAILCGIDNESLNSEVYTEEACRLRWAYLDFEEFQRRQLIAQELWTSRALLSQTKPRETNNSVSSFESRDVVGIGCERFAEESERIFEDQQYIALDADSQDADAKFDKKSSATIYSGFESVEDKLMPVSNADDVAILTRSQALSEAAADGPEVVLNANTSQERSKSPAAHFGEESVVQHGEKVVKDELQTKTRELSELEKNVLDEGLEISDFTIFSHDLKTQFEGFYNEVRGALPSMQDACESSDDDEDVEPVFSNLRVDEKTGEYVGHIVSLTPLSTAASSATSFPHIAPSDSAPAPSASVPVQEARKVSNHSPQANDHVDSRVSTDEKNLENAANENIDHPVIDWRQARWEGRECAKRADHTRATAYLTDAIVALESVGDTGSTDLALMLQERAESYMAIHHYAEAAEDWRRRLRLALSNCDGDGAAAIRARLQLGISLRFTGQYIEAAKEVDKVLQVEPENQLARSECFNYNVIQIKFIRSMPLSHQPLLPAKKSHLLCPFSYLRMLSCLRPLQ